MAAVDKLAGKQFFDVRPGTDHQLPTNIQDIEAKFAKTVLCSITLSYAPQYVEKVGGQSIAFVLIGRYGKPAQNKGYSYAWEDDRTRVEVYAHGQVVYTDLALENEVEKSEAAAQDFRRQQRQMSVQSAK